MPQNPIEKSLRPQNCYWRLGFRAPDDLRFGRASSKNDGVRGMALQVTDRFRDKGLGSRD